MTTRSDWPTYQHDNRRSGRSVETLPADRLVAKWIWRSPAPPAPAWSGPAKYDAYRMVRPLRSMRNYDPAFHVIAAGPLVWFGSSADDSVRCLEAATGRVLWTFTADAPVRIAPAYADGRIYFGSDDGHAYCLAADTGELIWKFSPAPAARRVLNDGRFISRWPCRTGVVVDEGTAYFAMGLLPWDDSYLCAVDARTGRLVGPDRYVALRPAVAPEGPAPDQPGVTMEGAIVVAPDRLFIPQGRIPPLMFARRTGRLLGSLAAGGGCFATLTEDGQFLHGPGNRDGWVNTSAADSGKHLAAYDKALAAVIDGATAFIVTPNELAAIDRASNEKRWAVPADCPYSLILAGDTLFAGGADAVLAFSASDGRTLWTGPAKGKVHGLAVSNGRLLATTDEGAVHCFAPGLVLAGAPAVSLRDPEEVPEIAEPTPPQEMALSPYLQFTGPDSAAVRWQTHAPTPTKLVYGIGPDRRTIEDSAPATDHEVLLTGLRKEIVYTCCIWDAAGTPLVFECDTHFNYSLPALPECSRDASDKHSRAAADILALSGVDRGLCLVAGCGDAALAAQLARQSNLRVVAVDTDPSAVAAARETLLACGLYGPRLRVLHAASLDELPFVGRCVNLLVYQSAAAARTRGADRLLRPGGGVAVVPAGKGWKKFVREPLAGIGSYTHQYASADNTAYGGESLAGVRGTGELGVQWLGEPGPRYQPDRNGRKPAPLAVNGRLFGQGRRRIVALDAYNGVILWSLEIPSFTRFNMPRDCGNWCADADNLYAAVKDQCWRIDAAGGALLARWAVVPGDRAGWEWDWGYLADAGDALIGSAVKKGTAFTAFVGHANWYDNKEGEATFKVCSDNLFSMDKVSGNVNWTYSNGLIVNPTITMTGGKIYFVACRNPSVVAGEARRVGGPEFWQDQFLVALDAAGGKVLWERPLAGTAAGSVVFYLAAAEGKLVLVASDVADGRYHTYAFSAADGSALWDTHFDWMSDNHGGHMSHPAIVAGRVFVRPRVLDLATGQLLPTRMPGGGCGTYVLTDRTAIFRSSHVVLWDFEQNKSTLWYRLRPGCWISTVAACGVVLSPEAGGGCSCGSWLETSIAFMPGE